MTFDVQMSFEEFFDCNRLVCLKTTLSRRINYYAMQYGYPVLGVFFAWVGVWTLLHSDQSTSAAVFPILSSLFFLWCRFRFTARYRKFYDKQAEDLVGTMTVDTHGVKFERKNGTATLDCSWNAFESWLERPDMFLMFTPSLLFFRIPKDKITTAEQEEVRGWLGTVSRHLD
jgi:hypothetical protein